MEAGRDDGRARADRLWRVALVALLVAGAGAAVYFGSITTAGFPADETAHAAYARALEEGRLPDVRTPQPGLEHGRPDGQPLASNQYIYVANHPPLFPSVQAVISGGLRAAGVADRPERPVGRALNAACTLGAALAAAALGRELTGRRSVSVLGAGLFLALPGLWTLASYGYSDGGALLALVLVSWAGVRAWRRPEVRALAWLGAAIALAANARLMALIAALGVAAVVTLRATIARDARSPADPADTELGVNDDAGAQPRHQLRSGAATDEAVEPHGCSRVVRFVRAGLLTVGPAAVLGSWWYVRNWIRFGDPGASTELIDRLDRPAPTRSLPAQLVSLGTWRAMLSDLVAGAYSATYFLTQPHLPAAVTAAIGLVALAGLVALVVPTRVLRAGCPPVPSGWPVLLVAVTGVLLAVAIHASNGGTTHPRYLLPAMPLLALGVAIGLDRLDRLAPAIALAGLVLASVAMAVQATRFMQDFQDLSGQAPLGLTWLPPAGAVVALGGLAVAAWSIAVASRTEGGPRPAPI